MTPLPLNRDCFVTSITLAFLKKFGLKALDWDPLMVRDAYEGVFCQGKMPQRLFDKLNCGLSLIGTDLFTASIEGFITGCACMNNLVIDGSTAPFVTLSQCAWGIWEYINLNGDLDEGMRPTETFCPDVIKYIQEVAAVVGVTKLPEWLKFAQSPQETLPDMSEDVDLFTQYMQRQEDYINMLNSYVTERQKLLADELKKLQNLGFIAEKTA